MASLVVASVPTLSGTRPLFHYVRYLFLFQLVHDYFVEQKDIAIVIGNKVI